MTAKKTKKAVKKKNPDRVKLGRKSRQKGKVGERAVAKIYRERGLQAQRGVQYKGGFNSPDIRVEELDRYFSHEVKWVEALNIHAAMEQSKADSTPNQVPLVVHKKCRTNWLVTLNLHDWINIVQRLLGIDDSINTFPSIEEFREYGKESLEAGNDGKGEEGHDIGRSIKKSSDLL